MHNSIMTLPERCASAREFHGTRRGTLRLAPLLLLAGLAACDDQGGGQARAQEKTAERPPPTVSVVEVRPQPVPITVDLPGRTSAFQTAEVRPQVNGVIRERLFKEGEEVKAGQQLYQIDPAPYEADLASAKASLSRAQAAVTSAQATVNRYRPLARAQAVSQQELDNAVATLRQAQADVESGRAAIRTAEINLQYTKVNAPIGGRTSRSSVTAGALVTANQTTALVSITQLDPIYVDMTQPSSTLLRLRRDMADGRLQQAKPGEAEVKLTLEDGTQYGTTGRLQFSEVIVDPGTSSVTLRALFPNPDGALMPGLFVHGMIQAGVNQNGILVPQQGVTRNQRSQAVAMVVKPDGVVEQRIVTTGQSIGDQWMITDGLQAGDRVVVEGVQRAAPGVKVQAEVVTAEQLRQRNIRQTAERQGS
jgi:membrane fusion protein (multidrug efflux system)